MKKRVIAGVATVGIVATAGVAWAVIQANLVIPGISQGVAQGGNPADCMGGQAVTLTVPDPVWSDAIGDYAVSTIDFSGITTSCVNLGTADIVLNMTDGASPASIASGFSNNLSATSGTITLDNTLTFNEAANAEFNYIVRNN